MERMGDRCAPETDTSNFSGRFLPSGIEAETLFRHENRRKEGYTGQSFAG